MNHLRRWTIVLLAVVSSCANPAANAIADNRPVESISIAGVQLAANTDNDRIESPEPMPTPEPVRQINKDPASLAKAFYEFYLDGFPTMQGNEVVFMRFLTPRFYNEAEKNDIYDPFLDTQEGTDETWKNNIKVSQVVIRGNRADLNVLLDGKDVKWKAKLTLVKKSGTWKIDAINMAVP